ncbi:glycogen debranching enzyme, partial [Vibrio makurazakiensis]
ASLLFAFGIPHILTADVLSHSQKGNNNAYCQDGETSWLNWENTENKAQFKTWLSDMVAARQEFMVPFIKAFSGEKRNLNRIYWRRIDGTIMEHDDWNRLSSVSLHMGIGKDGCEMLYLINQTNAPARFKLPNDRKQNWVTICDTNQHSIEPGHADGELLISPTSMAVLHFQPETSNQLNS